MLALNTAVKAGFDETLMLDPEDYVSEGSAENVFIVRDGVLHTPAVTSCLEGITHELQSLYRRLVRGELGHDLVAYREWLQAV